MRTDSSGVRGHCPSERKNAADGTLVHGQEVQKHIGRILVGNKYTKQYINQQNGRK